MSKYDAQYEAWKKKKAEEAQAASSAKRDQYEKQYQEWKAKQDNSATNHAEIIQKRVNNWISNNNNYVTNYKNRFANRTGSYKDAYADNAEGWLTDTQRHKAQLDQDAEDILSMLDTYGDQLDADWVKDVRNVMSEARKNQGSILDAFTADRDYWAQFDSKDIYADWQRYQELQDTEAMGSKVGELEPLTTQRWEEAQAAEKAYRDAAAKLQTPDRRLTDEEYAAAEAELDELFNTMHEANAQYNRAKTDLDYYSYYYGLAKEKHDLEALPEGYAPELAAKGWESYTADRARKQEEKTEDTALKELANLFAGVSDTSGFAVATREMATGFREDTSYKEPSEKWTDAQRNKFGYLYQQNPQAAEEYAIKINDAIAREEQEGVIGGIQANASSGFWPGLGHSAAALAAGGLGIADYYVDLMEYGVRGRITEKPGVTPFEYSQAVTSGIYQKLNEKGTLDEDLFAIGGKGWGDLYSLGMSAAQSMLSAYTLGGTGSMVQFFGSAAASGVDDAKQRGATDEQALIYGTLMGAAEAYAEKCGIDNLLSLSPGETVRQLITNILKQGAQEGMEEGLTSVLGGVADQLVLGDNSNFNALVRQYRADGMSAEEAKRQAWKDTAGDVIFDAIGGAFTGAVSGGVHTGIATAVQNYQDTKSGKKILETKGGTDALMQLAREMAEREYGSTKETINTLAEKAGAGDARSAGKLLRTVEAAAYKRNQSEIAKGLQDNGISAKQAKEIAEAVNASLAGFRITEKQTRLLETVASDERVTSAVDRVLGSGRSGVLQRTRMLNNFAQKLESGKQTANTAAAQQAQAQAENTATVDNVTTTEKTAPEGGYEVSVEGKTLDGNGNIISIKRVKSIQNGRMILETEDGAEVDAADASFGSEGEALIYETVAQMGASANAANILVNSFKAAEGMDAAAYAQGISEAFRYGKLGIPMRELAKSDFASKLNPGQQEYVYRQGKRMAGKQVEKEQATVSQKESVGDKKTPTAEKTSAVGKVYFDRKGRVFNEMQETALTTMEQLSAALGVEFYVYESYVNDAGTRVYKDSDGNTVPAPNGWYDPQNGSIHIDLSAGQDGRGTMLFTVAHELTHFIKQWSPAKFKVLANFLVKQYGEKGVSVSEQVKQQIEKAKQNGRSLSLEEAYEEMVADSMETMLTDGNVVQLMADLKQQDKGLWEKIKDWFQDLAEKLQRVVDAYKGVQPDTAEGRMVADMQDVIGVLQSLYEDALVDAGENFRRAEKNTTYGGGVSGETAIKRSERIVDQIRKSLADIMALDIVYEIDASNAVPYTSDRKTDEKSGNDVFKAQGGVASRPGFGKVILTKKGAVDTVYHGNGPAKQAAFPAIKAVIEKGIEIFHEKKHKGRNYDTVTFGAPVKFFGSKSPLGVVVKVFDNGRGDKNFYIHEICDAEGNYIRLEDDASDKKNSSIGLVEPTSTADAADNGIAPKTSIRNDGEKVNKKFSNREAALQHFGRTYSWKETGYLLTNGAKLDFSGRHEGASGGYRTVDHREILDIYPEDTELDGNGAMVDFMKQGNIRIMPEGNGINLSVKPTKAQEQALDDFISRARGEVSLDIDDEHGNTIVSVEYPRFTRVSKVLQDIRNYFDTGAEPRGSQVAQFHYSDRDPAAGRVNEVLEKENGKLKEDVQYLKELLKIQRSVTNGTKFTKTSVEAMAYQLMKANNAKGDKKELGKLLNAVYEYIAKGEELTWEDVAEMARPAVDWLRNHTEIKSELSQYAKDVLHDVRTSRVSLDESQQAEAAYRYGSFNDFRKSMMGSIVIAKDGVLLDAQWQEWARTYPDIFDVNMSASDMPGALADILSSLRNSDLSRAEYAYHADMIAQDLLQQVYDGYWRVSTLRTVADVKQREINALKSKHYQRMTDLRQFHQEKTDQLKRKHREETKRIRQEYREASEKKQKQIIERYQESRKKATEGRNKTAMRHKIQKVVKELNDLLLNESKKRHVPDSLKKAVADALDLVNMDTVGAEERAAKYANLIAKEQAKTEPDQDKIDAYTVTMENVLRQGEKMGQRLKELHDAYEEISASDDPDIANAYDPVIAGAIKELSQTIGKTSIRNMTLDQLSDVYDMYRMVLTRVRDANKTLQENIKESISNLASRVVGEVKMTGGEHTHRAVILYPVRKFLWNNLKPVYAMEHMGSDTLTEVFNNVRAGEDTWAKDVVEAREFYLDKSKKYGYDSWDFDKKYHFESASGIKFELTLQQILSLYAYSKREQAHDHLRLGGFVFDSSIETYKEKDNKSGKSILKYFVNTADAHQITPEILGDITGRLTKEQMGFVDDMQEYLSTVMGTKGNEVTSKMYGVKLFKEKFYFPLKSAKQFMFEQNEVSGEVKIKNSGFTNKVVAKANNPVILSNFMDVWAGHVNDMSMYHAFVLPLEDFNRVFNYNIPKKEGQPPVSVKGTIQSAYSPAALSYVKQLITDLNGGAVTDPRESTSKALMAKFKKASVFASMSVVVQQPSAVGRAFALIDPKYFIGRRVDAKRHKLLWAELKKYAPVAVIKEMGYFDTNMGRSAKDFIAAQEYGSLKEKAKAIVKDSGFRDEVLSWFPAMADEMTWCWIWEAVKREMHAKHPSLDVHSDAFLQAAGQRFTEVITKTQVYDSVLSRSANMRSKGGLMNMLTAFAAEPTTAINMIEDAVVQLRKGNKAYAKRTLASVFTSVFLNSLLVSLVYAMRDDDEDETFVEKYLSSFAAEMVDGVNPITYYPVLRDVWSVLQGYDIERTDMALVTDMVDSLKRIVQLSEKDTSTMSDEALDQHEKKLRNAWLSLMDTVFSFTGLPVKNIRRDYEAGVNLVKTIRGDRGGRSTTWNSLIDNLSASVKQTVPVWGWKADDSKADKLYRAITKGDAAYRERLIGSYDSDTALHSAIRTGLRNNDPRIREAAIAWNSGENATYMRIAKEILKEKHFVQDDVVLAIRAEADALKKDSSSSTSATSNELRSFFTMDTYLDAVMDNDHEDADIIKTDMIQTAVANGDSQEEAEKDFSSSFVTKCGKAYQDGELTSREAVTLLEKYGDLDREEADEKVQYWVFKEEYPAYDDMSQSAVTKYYGIAEPAGVGLAIYAEYRERAALVEGEDRKETCMKIIDSLPLTNKQKDALYFVEGWAESKLYEAPWH